MGLSDEFEAIYRKEFVKHKNLAEKAFEAGDYDTATKAFTAAAHAARKISDSVPGKQSKEKWLLLSKNYFTASEQLSVGIIPEKEKPIKYVRQPVIRISTDDTDYGDEKGDDYEKYVEEKLITSSAVKWEDIAGLGKTKEIIKESVVLSIIEKKPDAIKPWRGILLFGPPGTGKTLLAAATAGSLKATFFNVNVSNVLSKYFGESSKIIASLYKAARKKSPSIIFLDEFDSIAMSRSGEISEASRRVLSTLLSELDGLRDKKSGHHILTMAATNTPWDIDTAVLSRFQKRIYVPLPDMQAIMEMIKLNTSKKGIEFEGDIRKIAQSCIMKLFTGRDVITLCNEAIWNMVREQNPGLSDLADKTLDAIRQFKLKVRPLVESDFLGYLETIKSAVKQPEVAKYETWANEYGGLD